MFTTISVILFQGLISKAIAAVAAGAAYGAVVATAAAKAHKDGTNG